MSPNGARLFSLFGGVSMMLYGAGAASGVEGPYAGNLFSTNQAAVLAACDPDGVQASGALYRICLPSDVPWNGDLIVYAHGYRSPFDPLDLVNVFTATHGPPVRVYLMGFSEGGLITALGIEWYPEFFDGGLAMCGVYGSFSDQVNYYGDFRVVFDYFFPDLFAASVVEIPQSLIDEWSSTYENVIRPVVEDPANSARVDSLFAITGAAFDTADTSTQQHTIEGLLRYNVFATNDAAAKLGGQPFENRERVYGGSSDDVHLNATVARFTADAAAVIEMETNYLTTGRLSRPLVLMHTTGDQITPYWHATRYTERIAAAGNAALHHHIPIERYGHCQFDSLEILVAFNLLVSMVNSTIP